MSDLDVVGLASSEPEYHTTTGGVGAAKHYLFRALARKVNLLDVFQPVPSAAAVRIAEQETGGLGDATTRHRTIKRHPEIFRSKSEVAARHVSTMPSAPDVIFQWEFFFSPRTSYAPHGGPRPRQTPYVAYNDWTTRLTQKEFPNWADGAAYEPFHDLQVPFLQNAEKVFVFSDKARRSLIDDYGVREDRAITVWAGVNLPVFPQQVPKDFESQRILFVGNDYEAKGLGVLLEAFLALAEEFPEAQLTIVGDPKGFDVPEHARVHALGVVEDATVLDRLFKEATVFALPSRMEAFGHVYAEAMSHQMACLGSSVGAIPEIVVDGRTGLIANPQDTQQWTRNLRLLLSSSDLRRTYGRAGYEKAHAKYQWDHVIDRMLPHLQELRRSGT